MNELQENNILPRLDKLKSKNKIHAGNVKQKENVLIIADNMVNNVDLFRLTGLVSHQHIVNNRRYSSAKYILHLKLY